MEKLLRGTARFYSCVIFFVLFIYLKNSWEQILDYLLKTKAYLFSIHSQSIRKVYSRFIPDLFKVYILLIHDLFEVYSR